VKRMYRNCGKGINSGMAEKIEAVCPCCGQPATVEFKPAKWQGEQDKVIITHKKWQEGRG